MTQIFGKYLLVIVESLSKKTLSIVLNDKITCSRLDGFGVSRAQVDASLGGRLRVPVLLLLERVRRWDLLLLMQRRGDRPLRLGWQGWLAAPST